jgi:flagellar M-ring protein FliF
MFRKHWAQVRIFFSQLTPSQKWLIGAIGIILLFTSFFILQYAAAPNRVVISQFAQNRGQEAHDKLVGANIDAKLDYGQLTVPRSQEFEAHAVLAEQNLLRPDTSQAFTKLIEAQSPWLNPRQNKQAFLVAQQQVLASVIQKMRGVESADVMIAMPEAERFGRNYSRPTASVNVVMKGAKTVDRELVAAVANLVSGAVHEMTPQDVNVIDALGGRSYTVDSPDELTPQRKLMMVRQIEEEFYQKVRSLLQYIPGVIIAVRVETDSIIRKRTEQYEIEKNEPLRRQLEMEERRENTSRPAAPGARSNTQVSIETTTTGVATIETKTMTDTEFGSKALTGHTQTEESGQNATQVNVAVNVPRSFITALYKQQNPNAADMPDDAALKPIIDQILPQVEKQVGELVSTPKTPGVVNVAMVYDKQYTLAMFGGAEEPAAASTVGGLLAGETGKLVMLSALGLVSLALMFGMVRKALRNPPMPTAEELAGVPPTLPGDDEELVGEVDVHDASMAGVELDEDEMRVHKLAEQIAELISNNPDEAGSLFTKWVNPDE